MLPARQVSPAGAFVPKLFLSKKVAELADRQLEHYLETDAEYQAVLPLLPIQNTLPTVERFAVRGIYFTVVNYTTAKVDFEATDEEGDQPYRLLIDNTASPIKFPDTDTLIVFFPGSSQDKIFSISKGNRSFYPPQRIEWTIWSHAYDKVILHQQVALEK